MISCLFVKYLSTILGKRAGVIAAGVIVGVMILVAISAILIVGVVCIMCKRVNLHRWRCESVGYMTYSFLITFL